MAIEGLEKHFGTTAVGKGFITFDQLMVALEIQERENMEGKKHRLIGTILFDMGFITLRQIEEVLICIPLSPTQTWGETEIDANNDNLIVTLEQNRESSLA